MYSSDLYNSEQQVKCDCDVDSVDIDSARKTKITCYNCGKVDHCASCCSKCFDCTGLGHILDYSIGSKGIDNEVKNEQEQLVVAKIGQVKNACVQFTLQAMVNTGAYSCLVSQEFASWLLRAQLTLKHSFDRKSSWTQNFCVVPDLVCDAVPGLNILQETNAFIDCKNK
ncbi:hypothetical protein PR048_005907 [Dryococelus australis]|uniref:Uncharacterized protein n=1 Tax=Dryococelus australis TaxID=614101 RepID=A0ABQ9IAG9_9NEOP|nr:hypothetical protein PR048_005907 [Dryococelus australis]